MFGDEMILGTEARKLDTKGRFLVPKDNTSAEIGDTLLFIERENFIEIWDSNRIKDEVKRLKECLNKTTDMKLYEYYVSSLNEIFSSIHGSKINKVDKAGRILLGIDLIKKYNLNGEIYLEGADDCLRVWNNESFLKYKEENLKASEGKKGRL